MFSGLSRLVASNTAQPKETTPARLSGGATATPEDKMGRVDRADGGDGPQASQGDDKAEETDRKRRRLEEEEEEGDSDSNDDAGAQHRVAEPTQLLDEGGCTKRLEELKMVRPQIASAATPGTASGQPPSDSVAVSPTAVVLQWVTTGLWEWERSCVEELRSAFAATAPCQPSSTPRADSVEVAKKRRELVIFQRCSAALQPLVKALEGNAVAPPLLGALGRIASCMCAGRVEDAEQEYIRTTIGETNWHLGVYSGSLHMRTSLEKIQRGARAAHHERRRNEGGTSRNQAAYVSCCSGAEAKQKIKM